MADPRINREASEAAAALRELGRECIDAEPDEQPAEAAEVLVPARRRVHRRTAAAQPAEGRAGRPQQQARAAPRPASKRTRQATAGTSGCDATAQRRRTAPVETEDASAEDDSEGEGAARPSRRNLQEIADEHLEAARPQTVGTYKNQLGKFWWWLEHDPETGEKRSPPYSSDLLETHGIDKAVRFMKWVGRNMPGYDYARKQPVLKVKTVEGVHSALQAEFIRQQTIAKGQLRVDKVAKLVDIAAYSTVYTTAKNNLALKGGRPIGTEDLQGNTMENTLDHAQYHQFITSLVGMKTAAALRDKSWATYCCATVGRGDDCQLLYLSDLVKPRCITYIGPSPCYILPTITKGAKAKANGKVSYSGSIRHKDPILCAQNAVGQHLVMRFTIQGEAFPDPSDQASWNAVPLWPGDRPGKNLDCQTMRKAVNKYFRGNHGFHIKKVTHSFRVLAARTLDESGVDDTVKYRMGKWNVTAIHRNCLMYFKPCGLLASGGWPGAATNDLQQFWHERFCMTIPNELLWFMFPFLPRLREEVAELGLNAGPSVRGMPAVLECMAIVVVQDALELAERFPDNPVHAKLLDNPRFHDLLQDYKEKKASGYFEKARPRTQAAFQNSTTARLARLEEKIDWLITGERPSTLPPSDGPITATHTRSIPEAELYEQQRQDMARMVELAAGSRVDGDDAARRQQLLDDLEDDPNAPPLNPPPPTLRASAAVVRTPPAMRSPAERRGFRQQPTIARPSSSQIGVISPEMMQRPFASIMPEYLRQSGIYSVPPTSSEGFFFDPHGHNRYALPAHRLQNTSMPPPITNAGYGWPTGPPMPQEGVAAAWQQAGETTGGSGAARPGVQNKLFPELRRLTSVQQFWDYWSKGLGGAKAIKDLTREERKGSARQRYFEWKGAADSITEAAMAAGKPVDIIMRDLEEERKATGLSMPKLVKQLARRSLVE